MNETNVEQKGAVRRIESFSNIADDLIEDLRGLYLDHLKDCWNDRGDPTRFTEFEFLIKKVVSHLANSKEKVALHIFRRLITFYWYGFEPAYLNKEPAKYLTDAIVEGVPSKDLCDLIRKVLSQIRKEGKEEQYRYERMFVCQLLIRILYKDSKALHQHPLLSELREAVLSWIPRDAIPDDFVSLCKAIYYAIAEPTEEPQLILKSGNGQFTPLWRMPSFDESQRVLGEEPCFKGWYFDNGALMCFGALNPANRQKTLGFIARQEGEYFWSNWNTPSIYKLALSLLENPIPEEIMVLDEWYKLSHKEWNYWATARDRGDYQRIGANPLIVSFLQLHHSDPRTVGESLINFIIKDLLPKHEQWVLRRYGLWKIFEPFLDMSHLPLALRQKLFFALTEVVLPDSIDDSVLGKKVKSLFIFE